MKQLHTLITYFARNKKRLFLGIAFTFLANYFGVVSPQVARYIINKVKTVVTNSSVSIQNNNGIDFFIRLILKKIDALSFGSIVVYCGIVLVVLALLRGFFTYLMRQTLIVMSRHIEFGQKNDIYQHYQKLDASFLKQQSIGDLMNRISDDVSKVRMFTGPAIMYTCNMLALIGLSVWYMLRTNVPLTLCVLAPLPLLAYIIFKVNIIISKKSEQQQQQLSGITAKAQESYSGIRVIKAFVQETSIGNVFATNSNQYKDAAISLAKTEAWYFPSIALLIGISTLITIMVGGLFYINGNGVDEGTIASFVMYVSMLSFPFSSIGWVASIIQKAHTSQKRINEFLLYQPPINDNEAIHKLVAIENIHFENVTITYPDTNITALQHLNFSVHAGEKIAIIGPTGSGKTTLAQVLLRILQTTEGQIKINGISINSIVLTNLRKAIAYVPQEVFLFSDTITNNIKFGNVTVPEEEIHTATKDAAIYDEIMKFTDGFETIVGERGVTLSGGQKQRISIARALLKNSDVLIFDDCLSAVDVNTEHQIWSRWNEILKNKITLFITHRVSALQNFDKIIVLQNGVFTEMGAPEELLKNDGYYTYLYNQQKVES